MVPLRQCISVSLLVALFSSILGCSSLSSKATSPTPTAPTNSLSSTIFAFWYRTWNSSTTPAQVAPVNVVIGVGPAQVAEVHKLGKRALQYQTYYQAGPNTILLPSVADLPNVGFEINQQFVLNVFGTPNWYVMCPNTATIHKRVQQYVQSAIASGYDGLMVDNTFFNPPAHQICDGTHAHLDPTAEGGRAFLTLLSEVRQQLQAHNPNMMLITNPGSPAWADEIADGAPSLWDLSDYVVWESYGYTAHTDSSHDAWDDIISKSYQLVQTAPDKGAKTLALSYVFNVTEAQYAFAVARFFGMNWTANLGATPWGTYYNQIPFQLGNPVSPLPPLAPVLHRTFEHGEVFVNADSQAQTVTLPAGTLYLGASLTQNVAPATISLQPRNAAIVIY